jgi:flavin reductase (DIM6/NTAB) family NADH-FMN oxidoreductase RutF
MSAAHAIEPVRGPDERALREAFGRFVTGVAFVTADVDGAPAGLIVSSFTAVSLRPPLVSFCPARDSHTWRRMRTARAFAIHVLGAGHSAFARHAGVPGADRFREPLRDALAVFECDLEAEHAAGDHSLVLGRVRRACVSPSADPLVYFAGSFGAFLPT